MVSPGDLILGDSDGLVALTPAVVRSGIKAAQDKMALETQWIDSLVRGHSPAETFGLASRDGSLTAPSERLQSIQ